MGANVCPLESCRAAHQEYRNVGGLGTCREGVQIDLDLGVINT